MTGRQLSTADVRAVYSNPITDAAAAEILGCSPGTARNRRLALGIERPKKSPQKLPREKRPDPTKQEIMDALLLHQSITLAAAHFERSYRWLDDRIKRWDLHSYTWRVRIADPIEQQLDLDRAIIERAVMLGIWHIDRNGELQQFDKADPYRGKCRNLLERRK